ncbi:ATP-dependent helicase/nuclease subunit A [Weissella beninensis]|uniref:ATP-dependent helicase/nuclease subunit A n=1 Tax=Periweissella beninensis TaxID=504936 RepID=A0ABT0VFF0_9LACO|nr:ATP-dependent helicase/nuclease subunit A [Periweissella beninensis]MCM2436515.1 helicase-exonuclease AddAB subunit AddA [Periweissella beninensis]
MPIFTKSQTQAILAKDHNILVSASAGSGKTTVLVERVIQKIIADKNPMRIDELLIVTFTEAAAKEMRERIEKALQKALLTATDRQRIAFLQQQLLILPTANISTLHAYALKLIENYYHVIDLDPQFRLLADTAEVELLQSDILDDLFDQLYQTDDQFKQLVGLFANDRNDDGMKNAILRLYNFANARPNFDEWLAKLSSEYVVTDIFTESKFFKQDLAPLLLEKFTELSDMLANTIKSLSNYDDDKNVKKRLKQIQAEYAQVKIIENSILTASWDNLRNLINQLSFERIKGSAVKMEDPDLRRAFDEAKDIRAEVKDTINELKDNYFLLNEVNLQAIMTKMADQVDHLVMITSQFATKFTTIKRQKQLLDFSDLEHLALAIVKVPTIAATIQSQYREIMVDEYQDINPLQETLLTSLSNGHNMFMVGDVKQSIYGFRLADPSLFTKKFKSYGKNDHKANELIVLAENFRSTNNVIDFINLIFSQLMDEKVGDIEYRGPAKLIAGAKDYPNETTQTVELLVYTDDQVDELNLEETEAQEAQPNKIHGQLALIAKKIKALKANQKIYDRDQGVFREIQWSDIVILEPTRNINMVLLDVFKTANIPVVVNDTDNYFQTTEVSTMLSLFEILDNPYQDIPLVAVLKSPIVGFDENDLALIRLANRQENYYRAIKTFIERYLDQTWIIIDEQREKIVYRKLVNLLAQLDKWRKIAKQNRLVELIWAIYEDTDYLEYVGALPAGEQRRANLHALYQRAQSYENSSYIGLFSFIKYIEQLQKKDKDLGAAAASITENAVQVMTIHGSKGLEYPIVFLADATHKFNELDLRNTLLMNDTGIAMPYFDITSRLLIELPQQAFFRRQARIKNWAEQLRVLYVALTRAKQQLYIVGSYNSKKMAVARWQKALVENTVILRTNRRLATNNFMDWLGQSIIRDQKLYDELIEEPVDVLSLEVVNFFKTSNIDFSVSFYDQTDVIVNQQENLQKKAMPIKASSNEQYQIEFNSLKAILNYEYEYPSAVKTTAYQSVSEVKRLFEDPDDQGFDKLVIDQSGKGHANRYVTETLAQPRFIEKQINNSNSQAQIIGTATHLVLQNLDLTQVINDDHIQATITKLVNDELIEPIIAQKIKQTNILAFFMSEFGQKIQANHDRLKREQPFSMLMFAHDLYEDYHGQDERVLIHGIMDGYFFDEKNEITLFDYKTDFVKDGHIQTLSDKYQGQLKLYATALQKIEKKPIKHVILVSLALNETIELHID